VVVVLSKEFISKPYPMEELQLLLEWQRQGSPAVLLPVYHGIAYEGVINQAAEYQEAGKGTRQRQWAKDLSLLANITSFRADQVPLGTRLDTDDDWLTNVGMGVILGDACARALSVACSGFTVNAAGLVTELWVIVIHTPRLVCPCMHRHTCSKLTFHYVPCCCVLAVVEL
jgi:hypothetical protein